MIVEDYEMPASGDKAEAIRNKYCLENDRVYDTDSPLTEDDYIFYEKKDEQGDVYLCFEASELDKVRINTKLYYIKRITN